ncbi:hypothetical protein AHAS_Ahas07G0046500 [Arachis hypogaea]
MLAAVAGLSPDSPNRVLASCVSPLSSVYTVCSDSRVSPRLRYCAACRRCPPSQHRTLGVLHCSRLASLPAAVLPGECLRLARCASVPPSTLFRGCCCLNCFSSSTFCLCNNRTGYATDPAEPASLCALSASPPHPHPHLITLSSLPSPRQSSLSVSHGLTSSLSQSLTSSPHLDRRRGPVHLPSLRRRQKQTEPDLVPWVVVVVVFLLLTVSVSHRVSTSPFPALFVAGSRGNRSRWAGLRCRLLASSLAVSFSLAISFSFAVSFLRATRFDGFIRNTIIPRTSDEDIPRL